MLTDIKLDYLTIGSESIGTGNMAGDHIIALGFKDILEIYKVTGGFSFSPEY